MILYLVYKLIMSRLSSIVGSATCWAVVLTVMLSELRPFLPHCRTNIYSLRFFDGESGVVKHREVVH